MVDDKINNITPVDVLEIVVNHRVRELLGELRDTGLFGDSIQQVVERLLCERIRMIYDEHELIRGDDWIEEDDDGDEIRD